MTALYNEIEPFAADWLDNLQSAGHIAPGTVDRRSIADLKGDDLRGYSQVHFFAGIGGWSHALRLAGWPDDVPVWTGSCPCQPFSVAGAGRGEADERHLWPEMRRLISECRPSVVFGEQVASKLGRAWLAGVRSDLEALGYAVGAADLCAAGVGAPHIRQRICWVAYAPGGQRQQSLRPQGDDVQRSTDDRTDGWQPVVFYADCDEDGLCPHCGDDYSECECIGPTQDGVEYREVDGVLYGRRLGNADDQRPQGHDGNGDGGHQPGREPSEPAGHGGTPSESGWRDSKWHLCRDGKHRRIPTEPSFQPLAARVPARVGRLRGYGNAIVPQVAALFIRSAAEAMSRNQ